MPVNNALKKMIVFSSTQNRKVIEGIVKDQSCFSGRSESAIIEQAIIQSLMPSNNNAQYWIKILYDGGTLSEAYKNVFSSYAAGLNWKAQWANGYILVEQFSRLLAMTFPKTNGTEEELYHLRSQMKAICEVLHRDGGDASDNEQVAFYVEQLNNLPQHISLLDISTLLLRNWDKLGSYSVTYRALTDIASISASQLLDDCSSRIQFIITLKKISDEWEKT